MTKKNKLKKKKTYNTTKNQSNKKKKITNAWIIFGFRFFFIVGI